MKRADNINSVPSTKKTDLKSSVDPKEFQKALDKVEESEQADQKDKRNKANIAPEEEELETESENTPTAGTFGRLMEEEAKSSSVFEGNEGTSQTFSSSENESYEEGISSYTPEYQEGQTSHLKVDSSNTQLNNFSNSSEIDQESMVSSSESSPQFQRNEPTNNSYETNNNQFSNSSAQIENTQNSQNTSQSSSNNEGNQSNSNSSNKSVESTKKQSDKKTTKKKKTPEKKTSKKTNAENKLAEKALDKTEVDDAKKELLPNSNLSDEENALSGKRKEVKSTGSKTGEIDSVGSSKEAKDAVNLSDKDLSNSDKGGTGDDDEMAAITDAEAPVTLALDASNQVQPSELSSLSNFPKDVFELFQKMVGLLVIAKEAGTTKTTITLNMPGSTFDKSEVTFTTYDTAPNNYNVQFTADPEAVEKFAKNLQALNNAIADTKLSFSINLLPPKLSRNYLGKVTKVDQGKDGGQEKGGGKK
jgi:hypothetical protein